MATTAIIEVEPGPPAEMPPRFSRNLLIIVGIGLLLVIGGGIAAWLMLGDSPATRPGGQGAVGAADVFIEVPAMIVNLRSADGTPRLIKIRLMLVPSDPEAEAVITARLPVIIDSFQPFLRELRPEDLAGSAAIFRIKEELLLRANGGAGIGTVKDVLIQDLIEQ